MSVLADVAAISSLHVAAGVVVNPEGAILIARRPDHLHQGGLWEFPGGKVEAGETVEQALRRELEEELAIRIGKAEPLITVRHSYPDRKVKLEVFRVDRFEGIPSGMLGQPIRWVKPDELHQFAFPAANRPIVTAAKLPDRYGIVDLESEDFGALNRQLQSFVDAGVTLVRLRANQVGISGYRRLAEKAVTFCHSRQIKIVLSADPALVVEFGADGLHINSEQLNRITCRPVDESLLFGVSCHNLDDLIQAEAIGADFGMLSPVLKTKSHPDRLPLGWGSFSEWVNQVNIPVFALGGMCPEHLRVAKCHGAQGISGIRGLI